MPVISRNNNITSRAVQCHNDLLITTNESILIIDSACDQSIISLSSFVVGKFIGIKYGVNGALPDMKSTE